MKEFNIFVDYHYGPCEEFRIIAKDLTSAKKKAKRQYARMYFKTTLIKCVKAEI